MSSTNLGKNRYSLISCFDAGAKYVNDDHLLAYSTLVFILSPSFLSISADALHMFHFVLKRLLPVGLGFASPFTGVLNKVGIHSIMSFLLPFLLFPITQDLFLLNFLARTRS